MAWAGRRCASPSTICWVTWRSLLDDFSKSSRSVVRRLASRPSDRGQPAAFPAEYVDPREGDLERPADIAVMRLFFVDRGDDPVALEAACAQLVALEGERLPRLSAARPPSARRSAPRWRVTSSARHGIGILFGRHRTVERPVQVAERNGDSHPRNREFRLVQFRAHQMRGSQPWHSWQFRSSNQVRSSSVGACLVLWAGSGLALTRESERR
jgi:hypothetical protein